MKKAIKDYYDTDPDEIEQRGRRFRDRHNRNGFREECPDDARDEQIDEEEK